LQQLHFNFIHLITIAPAEPEATGKTTNKAADTRI